MFEAGTGDEGGTAGAPAAAENRLQDEEVAGQWGAPPAEEEVLWRWFSIDRGLRWNCRIAFLSVSVPKVNIPESKLLRVLCNEKIFVWQFMNEDADFRLSVLTPSSN